MNLRERIASGDKRALAEAFTSYRPLVIKMLRRDRSRLDADLDDLIQEAFLRLPECARKCAPETTMGGCVATATLQAVRVFDNSAATVDQPHRWKTRLHRADVKALASTADRQDSPEDLAYQRERVHHLSGLLLDLTPRQRQLLIDREINRKSPVELGASRSLIYRARQELVRRAARSPLAEEFAAMPQSQRNGFARAA